MAVAIITGHTREPQYDVRVIEDVRVPSSVGGVRLSGDLYLPETSNPVPALVTLHSARKDGVGGIGTRRYLRYFAERGYGVLYVDCAGIGASEGNSRPMLSPGEVDDGVAVVEWAARQPWCTGKVGMWGYSHGGMTTLAVASRRPAGLGAIFPIMGMTELGGHLVHPGGVRGGLGMFGQLAVFNIFCALLPPLRAADQQQYETLWKERLEDFEPWLVDAWRHGPDDPVWDSRRWDPSRIEVPSLCAAGWADMFCGPMIRAYEAIRAPKKLVAGPWLHVIPDSSTVQPLDSMAMACEWWDHWLTGDPVWTDPEPATVYLGGAQGRWLQLDSWPPAGDELVLAAAADRALRPSGRPDPATVRVTTDPTVGALGGLSKIPIPSFGYPVDQHDDDMRSLSLTTVPLTEPVVLAGSAEVRLAVDEATTAAWCVVKLADVDEEGRSQVISSATAKIAGPVSVTLDPACHEFVPGHRIRLVVAGSDFPGLWPPEAPEVLSLRLAGTAVRLPVARQDDLSEVAVNAPVRPGRRGQRRAFPQHRWEVARDLHRDGVRVSVETTEGGRWLPGEDLFLELRYLMSASSDPTDSDGPQMSTSGWEKAQRANGDEVEVRAGTEVTRSRATIRAEVRINASPVFSKEWTL